MPHVLPEVEIWFKVVLFLHIVGDEEETKDHEGEDEAYFAYLVESFALDFVKTEKLDHFELIILIDNIFTIRANNVSHIHFPLLSHPMSNSINIKNPFKAISGPKTH